jgi:hypothetical protein
LVSDRARHDGATAREWAGQLLGACGFSDVAAKVRLEPGVDVDYCAVDRTGQQWLFDVWGSFTTVPAGLRRTDTLWRALGKAAVVRMARPELPVVLLTTSTPRAGSSGDRAWRALARPGEGGALVDVVEFDSTEDLARLCGYARDGLPGVGAKRGPRAPGGGAAPRRSRRAR